jgi:hypothetical protein
MTTRQPMTRYAACLAFLALALGLGAGTARAEFVLVENFEGLQPGSIGGQNGWYASGLSSKVVTLSGQGDNQVLELIVTSGVLRKGLTIPEDETRMLFLRFRFDGHHNYSLGMSHLSAPTEYDDFGPELRRVSAQDRLEIHNGSNYDVLDELTPRTWYNLWALVDNASGTTRAWLHARDGEAATAGDQLAAGAQTVFNFRTFSGGDLVNFYLKAADGSSGRDPLWLDDIHIENVDGSVNLANPVPEPATLSLLALACLPALRRRRRA